MSYKKTLIYICIITLNSVLILHLNSRPVVAGWLFWDNKKPVTTGLDLCQGYDRNTVVTLSGQALNSPEGERGPLTLELATSNETISIVLAPGWYLKKHNPDINAGDKIKVHGSRAKSKNGQMYLIAQWIILKDGKQFVLRTEEGKNIWYGHYPECPDKY